MLSKATGALWACVHVRIPDECGAGGEPYPFSHLPLSSTDKRSKLTGTRWPRISSLVVMAIW